MRFMSIASGSSGNCIYAGNAGTDILIDVGISAKRIEEGLNSIGRSISDMDGILITHEHSDHIASLKVISKRYHLPLYATNGTINEILNVKGMEIEPEIPRPFSFAAATQSAKPATLSSGVMFRLRRLCRRLAETLSFTF